MSYNGAFMKLITIFAMIAVALFSRLVPHLPNMTAVGAVAIFAGATIKPRWLALVVPLILLIISDLILGFYSGLLFNYGAWLLICWGASHLLSSDRAASKSMGWRAGA